MAIDVKVPSVGESVTSGVLASWRVNDGDFVKRDDPLFDLETDKITQEATAEADGRISLKAREGDEVEIGQVVAEIDDTAEPEQADEGEDKEKEKNGDAADAKKPEAAAKDAKAKSRESSNEEGDGDHPLSPAARRAAEETGVDPSRIKGTGKDGRITKGDVMQAAQETKESSSGSESSPASGRRGETPAQKETGDTEGRTTRKKLSTMRRRIGERLVASQRDTATLTTFNEVDLSAVKALRARHQDAFTKKHGVKLGFMSFFVKAAVHALKEVPEVNAQLDGEHLVLNHFYDIAVAVSTEKGLLVPVIRDCDQIGYAEIERRISNVAERAKEGKLQLEELEGGVFTITNGGIFGSMLSTPVINPPQSAILGMHAIIDRPVAIDGAMEIRPMMYLALSYDHRIIDGREAVTFLRKIKEALEEPSRTLLEV